MHTFAKYFLFFTTRTSIKNTCENGLKVINQFAKIIKLGKLVVWQWLVPLNRTKISN